MTMTMTNFNCLYLRCILAFVTIIIYIVAKHKKENNMNDGSQNNLL